MKKNYFLLVMFFMTTFCYTQTIFINEIHYDNTGADVDEGFEISGPAGTDLNGYTVELYNGNGGGSYDTVNLSGIIPNQQNNLGTLWFSVTILQNGSPDGLALIDSDGTTVIQFLSYEGVITATDGPANGMSSTDIGVSEGSSTAIGESLQLIGEGSQYSDFTWTGPIAATNGLVNTGQTLPVTRNQIIGFAMYPNPVSDGKFVISSNSGENKQIEIYSMIGKRVYTKTVKANEIIDIVNLNSGIYLLRVQENNKIATRKLIVN
ncbi:T9SS type A sorting domain-containing protein [Lutibacter profundi]|nr:T9SS type A sorting domain-containing protein [Lutibacter profundi]